MLTGFRRGDKLDLSASSGFFDVPECLDFSASSGLFDVPECLDLLVK